MLEDLRRQAREAQYEAAELLAKAAASAATAARKQKVLDSYEQRARSYTKEYEKADNASKGTEGGTSNATGILQNSSCPEGNIDLFNRERSRCEGYVDSSLIDLDPDILAQLFGITSPSALLVDFDDGIS